MPAEFSRTTARKRIALGDSYVDVPIITKISFVDGSDRYQETESTIDNSGVSDRQVHVDTVYHTNPDLTQDTSVNLLVERIDRWNTIDNAERYQETQLSLDNVTGSDTAPPSFTTHLKRHVVRYKNPNDANVWIDSELIDEFVIVDASDRYQETHYALNNPMTDDAAQADPNDPEISDTAQGIDPPWRTDPFQNIVNFSSHVPYRRKQYQTVYSTVSAPTGTYEGTYGVTVPPLNFSDGVISATTDAGAAVSQAQAITSARIMSAYAGATVTEESGILTGPEPVANTVSFRTTWWIYVGDGYNMFGVKVGTVPDIDYVNDPDEHFWWYNGNGIPFFTDPGPPPI